MAKEEKIAEGGMLSAAGEILAEECGMEEALIADAVDGVAQSMKTDQAGSELNGKGKGGEGHYTAGVAEDQARGRFRDEVEKFARWLAYGRVGIGGGDESRKLGRVMVACAAGLSGHFAGLPEAVGRRCLAC